MHGTSEFQVAAQTDGEIVKASLQGTDRKKVGESLCGMLVTAVARIDDRIVEDMEATRGAPSLDAA